MDTAPNTYSPRNAEIACLALLMIRDEGQGRDSSWCAGVAMSALASIEEHAALPYCHWHQGTLYTMETQLCDDDGIVRSGRFHDGTDYPCTGGAHFGGEHIRCTSPAHNPAGKAGGVVDTAPRAPFPTPSERDEWVYSSKARIVCESCGEWIYVRRRVAGGPLAFPPKCQICGAPTPELTG